MKLMEVRCCCVPQKLLGYLPAPEDGKKEARFWIPARLSEPFLWQTAPPSATTCAVEPARPVVLKVEKYGEFRMIEDSIFDVERHVTPAYKAEGLSIETLRLIPEFLELK